MNNKFDEFTKSLAQSVTRRGALKKFGLAGAMALACLGLANKAKADSGLGCQSTKDCADPGPSAVCCKQMSGIKSCVFDKTQCSNGKVIWV